MSFRMPCIYSYHKTVQLCHARTEYSVEFKRKSQRFKTKPCFKAWHSEVVEKRGGKNANHVTAKSVQSTASNCNSAHPEAFRTRSVQTSDPSTGIWSRCWTCLCCSTLLQRRARGGTNTHRFPTAQAACVHVTHQCNNGGGCHSLLPGPQPSVGTRFSNRVLPTQRQCPNTQR